jgi:uncharacterized protein
MACQAAHFPARAPIDAYGNGGFRFADMSHRGSLIIVPSGIYAWGVCSMSELTPAACDAFFTEMSFPGFVLLGTGAVHEIPAAPIRQRFADAGIGLEAMTTGAACRTFNIVLAEGRDVAAGLIAVE